VPGVVPGYRPAVKCETRNSWSVERHFISNAVLTKCDRCHGGASGENMMSLKLVSICGLSLPFPFLISRIYDCSTARFSARTVQCICDVIAHACDCVYITWVLFRYQICKASIANFHLKVSSTDSYKTHIIKTTWMIRQYVMVITNDFSDWKTADPPNLKRLSTTTL
jgi:hypothetical protein